MSAQSSSESVSARPVAIVTGASRGIGAATAVLLATRGYDICVNYRSNRKAAEAVLARVREAGATAVAIAADIASETEVETLFRHVDEQLGRPRVLINNAAFLLRQSPLVEMSAQRINAVLGTNVTGTFLCCREAVKRMAFSRGGSGGAIVNVSSGAARIGSPNEYIDYAASKGAVDTLTLGLAKEVAGEGIRVNGVRPGFIHTDMHAAGGEPNRIERLRGSIPLGRGGEPEEVAAAIAWLVSEEASYTTGAIVDVTGGR